MASEPIKEEEAIVGYGITTVLTSINEEGEKIRAHGNINWKVEEGETLPTISYVGIDSNYNPQFLVEGTTSCTLTATTIGEKNTEVSTSIELVFGASETEEEA